MVRIKRLEIKNWVGLSELSLHPGKVNTLTGHKGSGKTSAIEALEKVFLNKNRRVEVIRHGEDEATLFVQTDDGLEIERKVRDGRADYLKVRKSGESVPSTETFLRRLVNGEIFRPLEFVSKTPEEQAKIILNMLEIPWNLDSILSWFGEIPSGISYDVHILKVLRQIEKHYYDLRELTNREIKVLEAQVKGYRDNLPPNYDGEHWRAQKVQEHYAAVAQAEENNRKIAEAKTLISGLDARIKEIQASIETEKQAKMAEFKSQRAEGREYVGFLKSKIESSQQAIINQGEKLAARKAELDAEMERKIQAVRDEYAEYKLIAEEISRKEVKASQDAIAGFEKSITAKETEVSGVDALEVAALESLDRQAEEKGKTAQAEAGNASKIAEGEIIPVEPLKLKADEVAKMQSFLYEFDRMNNIIREKLAPRQENSRTLTARIDKARELPMQLLQTASVPIPQINVDSEGRIRIGQTLISDLSEGEHLELAFQVAHAQAGELKVICLDGIGKINESDRAWLEKEMQTDDFQYFVTNTDDGELRAEIDNTEVKAI